VIMTWSKNLYIIVTCRTNLKFVKLFTYQNEIAIRNITYFNSRFLSGKEVITENGETCVLVGIISGMKSSYNNRVEK
jgi:hypothetical protein